MTKHAINKEAIFAYLEEIKDPEVPVLSIIDLGIVRDIKMNDDEIEIIEIPRANLSRPAVQLIAPEFGMSPHPVVRQIASMPTARAS